MRNILVVEDSPMVLKILEQMFRQQADLQPLFCATLNEAQVLLEASAELFFAAIIDLNLPDAPNGEIVDLVLHYQLPCIVLTGSYDEQRREEMLLKGVVDYVLKESQYSYDYAFRLLHRLERNRSVKILVADDSNATRHFIRNVLRSHLYQIHEAADGEEALRILQEQPDFDLLITDHSMPGLSGFELTKVLRQKLKRHDLSILGLSADSKGSLSAQFIKHGADDFLRKPFCPEELTCRVMSTHGFSVVTQGDQARVIPNAEAKAEANSGGAAPNVAAAWGQWSPAARHPEQPEATRSRANWAPRPDTPQDHAPEQHHPLAKPVAAPVQ